MEAGNLTGDYTCILPDPVSLTGDWQVGLAEITYANSWDTLRDGWITLHTYNYDNVEGNVNTIRRMSSHVRIPDGYYGTVDALIEAIHGSIKKFWIDKVTLIQHMIGDNDELRVAYKPFLSKLSNVRKSPAVSLLYDTTTQRINFRLSRNVVRAIYFSPNLMSALGLSHGIEEQFVVGEYPPNLLGSISTMYVYTDIIAPQIVGNVRAPLIRNVAVSGAYGSVVTVDFPNIHYVDLLNRNFQSIGISIKSEAGSTIPFNFGKTIVKLHFRRKRLQ
jgi:hypothetical protein